MVVGAYLGGPRESSEEHAGGSLGKAHPHLISQLIGNRGAGKQGRLLSGTVRSDVRPALTRVADRECEIARSGYSFRTGKMFEHAPNIPFIRNRVAFMDRFGSIARGNTQLLERLCERMCVDSERSQMVFIELRAFVCHVVCRSSILVLQ